nr:excalibur calcium-binding domain-containing protein [Microlunatus antarcticus]
MAEVHFTVVVDASPKEVVKGKKITVTAGIYRGGGDLPFSAKTALEFRPDGGDWRKVKSVTSSNGTLKTKVKATKSGNYRFRYAGSSESAPATSSAVHVVVRPKPKAYKSCKALTKVYKHGVGKNGATEVGLGLTNWTWSTPTYKKNKKFDPDHDGVACEKV